MSTFGDVLKRRLAVDPGRPLITYYDDGQSTVGQSTVGQPADGSHAERTELSVTTYGNWVAKTASYLAEEHDLAAGDRIVLDLPAHWLGPVFLGAAWWLGLVVVPVDDPSGADLTVCGPDGVSRWAGSGGRGGAVVATALHPLGLRFPEPLPDGVHDFGVEVWSQPDSFVPWEPVGPGDEAAPGISQAELWGSASDLTPGARVLSVANPVAPEGRDCFVAPFVAGGSLVLVRPRPSTTAARLDEIAAVEHATTRL